MGYRLVEVLEHGWDLSIRCGGCGQSERRSKAHFLGPWRKYLNADVHEIAKRLKCPCGHIGARASEMGGAYAHFGMVSDYFVGRALLIRKTLAEAGLDPEVYGYPPLRDIPKVEIEPR